MDGGAVAGPDWPAILEDYQDRTKKVKDICAARGIGCSTLFKHVRAAGLPLRHPRDERPIGPRRAFRRLERMVHQHIARLERRLAAAGPEAELDVRALRDLIRSVDELKRLERSLNGKDGPAVNSRQDEAGLRSAIARRLEALGREAAA